MEPVARRPREPGARRAFAAAGLRAEALREIGMVSHAFSHFRQELFVWEAVRGAEKDPRAGRAFVRPENVAVATATRRALVCASVRQAERFPENRKRGTTRYRLEPPGPKVGSSSSFPRRPERRR